MSNTRGGKNKLTPKKRLERKMLALAATLSTINPAFAVNPDTAGRTILKIVFNIMLFGGIIMAAIGIYMIGKAISDGENAPPGALGKGIGFAIAGIILIAARFITEKVTGINVDSFSFFG